MVIRTGGQQSLRLVEYRVVLGQELVQQGVWGRSGGRR
jgi:hypothetical protein